MKYFMGLDNGGTATKAALFDIHGKEIGSYGISTESIKPRPGFVERDMEEMWLANARVIQGVLIKTGVQASDVICLGISGHGKGLYLWGKDDRPLRPGIISTDNRAYQYMVDWRKDGTEEKAFKLSCQHVMACQPVALLAWLRDTEPENYRNIQYVFECKDYVRFRLTGRALAEITDYSGSGLMNLHTGDYDGELLSLFGIEEIREALPPLVKATDLCGTVTRLAAMQTGLEEGTPVIGGMFDINACAIAAGVTDPSSICMIAGTWSINEYLRRTPILDGKVQMNSFFCLPEYYLIEESSPTSAGNFEWFIQQLLPEFAENAKRMKSNVYDAVDQWVESLPPRTYVPVFLPFLMGSNVHPNARGSFIGISYNHTRKHLVRAVFEGITFCHRYHLEKLLATRETPPERIRLAGGAARARVWAQMFADVMNIPVETVEAHETGALGCAIACAAAVGEYQDIEDAVRNMTRISAPILPIPENVEIYNKKYEAYRKILESLDGIWDDMQMLAEEKY